MYKPAVLRAARAADRLLLAQKTKNYCRLVSRFVEVLYPEGYPAVTGALRARRWDLLLEIADALCAQSYSTDSEHYRAHQLAALIRKYPFDGLAEQAEEAAWRKFRAFEARCRWMNVLFRRREATWDPAHETLHRMRSWIRYVIGEQPDLAAIWGKCGFGPGASVLVGGDATNYARKLSAETLSVTPGALPYAIAALRSHPQAMEFLMNREPVTGGDVMLPCDLEVAPLFCGATSVGIVNYNKITFVPKTATVFRSIAVEPLLNGYLQKGADEMLRLLLRRVGLGLDLRDQEPNQKMAQAGSADWESDDPYCTIDLSSASDCVSIGLARCLLPPEWFHFLDALRSKWYLYRGELRQYHKFMSMGNGFCFPLQTLFFASACVAASQECAVPLDFRVYGDDIIVRRSVADRVLSILRLIGAVPNTRKTYTHGPFRESCGKDYFGGVDVRPIFLDTPLDSVQEVIKFHNSTYASPWSVLLDPVRQWLRGLIPEDVRFLRPFTGDPDTAFEVPYDIFMGSSHPRFNRALCAWSWPEFVTRPVSDKDVLRQQGGNILLLIAALRGNTAEEPYAFRRKTTRNARVVSRNGGILVSPLGRAAYDGLHVYDRIAV